MAPRMMCRRSQKGSESTKGDPLSNSDGHQPAAEIIKMNGRGIVWSLAFLDDGKYIVSGGLEGAIRRWSTKEGLEVGAPMVVGEPILSIAASLDGKLIVTGTDSGRLVVWDAVAHKKVGEVKAHARAVRAIDLSPVSPRVATGSNDRTACVWSISTRRQLLGPLRHDSYLAAVKYSPNGDLLATATWVSDTVKVYDAQSGYVLFDFPISVNSSVNQSLVWSTDGEQLFALSLDGKIHSLNLSTGVLLSWPIHSSHNPRCITMAGNGTFIAVSADTSVSFWDTITHAQIGRIVERVGVIRCMAISPDNTKLVSGGDDRNIVLRSLKNTLPGSYLADTRLRQRREVTVRMADKIGEMEDTIESLRSEIRALKEQSKHEIMKLKTTIRELRNRLTTSQQASISFEVD